MRIVQKKKYALLLQSDISHQEGRKKPPKRDCTFTVGYF